MSRRLAAVTSVSGLTLASRVLGFVRDVIMFRLLGTSWVMGTFVLAWMLPNLLRRLVGEGALSASLIPAYTKALEETGEEHPQGRKRARGLLAAVVGALAVLLLALTVAVWAGCALLPPHWLGHAAADGATAAESGGLLLALTAILFPYILLISLVSAYGGALHVHRSFGWPAALPVVLNVFWIGGLLIGAAWHANDPIALAKTTAWFLLAAGGAQLALAAWRAHTHNPLSPPRWPSPGDPARHVFRSMLPTVLGISMVQLNTLLDQVIAYYLIAPGANGHVYMANRLLLFPHALTSLALATVVFPEFAALAARQERERLAERLGRAVRATLMLSIPASVGLMLVAGDLLRVVFVGGEYQPEDATWSARTTVCLVGGLPFLGMAQLYARALYAFGDTATPARVTMALVPINLGLNLIFVLGLGTGVPGLTLATSLCAVVNALLLRRAVTARCGAVPAEERWLLHVVLATAVMAAVVVGARAPFDVASRGAQAALWLVAPIALGIGAFLGVHRALSGRGLRQMLAE